MKTSVISPEISQALSRRRRQLRVQAVVFDGSTDYHDRDQRSGALGIDEHTIPSSGVPVRWAGRVRPKCEHATSGCLVEALGIMSRPTLGDGRQSGTSDSPSILNCSPESAAGGGLAWLRTGDRIRIDLAAGRCDMLVSDEEIARRRKDGLPPVPESATPWQDSIVPPSGNSIAAPSWKWR
jgi:dihydroxy-acid dehydratase